MRVKDYPSPAFLTSQTVVFFGLVVPCAESPVMGTEGPVYPSGQCAHQSELQPAGWGDWVPLGSIQRGFPWEEYWTQVCGAENGKRVVPGLVSAQRREDLLETTYAQWSLAEPKGRGSWADRGPCFCSPPPRCCQGTEARGWWSRWRPGPE